MSQFGISQPVRRVEDDRLLRGRGCYIDDVDWAGQARAVFLRAPVAHAAIASIDVSTARSMKGVLAIYTAADLEAEAANGVGAGAIVNRDGSASAQPLRPALASDRVRHVGEAVAIVIAETVALGRDAAEAIEVDYQDLEPVVEMTAALADGAPLLHEEAPGNLCFDWADGDEAAVDAALAAAAHRVRLELVNNRVVANPMETRGALARWTDADKATGQPKLRMETNAQGVWDVKRELAERMQLPPEQIQVTTQDVGGGFGIKAMVYPEQIAVAFAARRLGRPIKWVADRSESFLADAMGRAHETAAVAGFDADHRLVALKVETLADMGAHLSQGAPYIPTACAVKVVPGVYDFQHAFYGVKGVFTNTTPVDAYRGAGRPESIYMLERLMDKAARQFGVDPIEIRLKNYIPKEAMPYVSAVGETYDTGDFARVTRAGVEKAGLADFAARAAASKGAGKLRGLGVCYYIESILGSQSETAKVAITESGEIELYVGTQSNGQGHETAYAQILNQRAGVPFEKIRIVQGDSDRIARGGGTGGSRSVTMQGAAINAAADQLVEQLRAIAEEELEVAAADLEFRDGAFHIVGADRSVTLIKLARRARETRRADLTISERRNTVPGRSYPNGCHIAEVEIDPETGSVAVVAYTMVDDFGVLINPLLAEGQAQGGVVQGIGQALTEHTVYDETGQLLSGSFMDYGMPRADDAPWMAFYSEGTPSTANPIGMKGCGEAGTVGALAAVTNACLDALWPLGVRDVDMPLTPSRIWALIEAARAPIAAE